MEFKFLDNISNHLEYLFKEVFQINVGRNKEKEN